MNRETIKEKIGDFFSKLGKKNLIVIASVTVLAVALIVGIAVFNRSEDKGFDYSQGTGMQDVNSESDKDKENQNSVDTYFFAEHFHWFLLVQLPHLLQLHIYQHIQTRHQQ